MGFTLGTPAPLPWIPAWMHLLSVPPRIIRNLSYSWRAGSRLVDYLRAKLLIQSRGLQ